MLPPAHRLRTSADFTAVMRHGRRVRRGNLVVHALVPAPGSVATTPARVGLVVSRSVGGSVVRHRVSRRLRALVAPRLGSLPGGSATVLRALPEAAAASSEQLAGDLDGALQGLIAGPR